MKVARYISRAVLLLSALACLVTHVSTFPLTMWHVWPLGAIVPCFAFAMLAATPPKYCQTLFHNLSNANISTFRVLQLSNQRNKARWRRIPYLVPWYGWTAGFLGLVYAITSVILMMGWQQGDLLVNNGGVYSVQDRGGVVLRTITASEYHRIRAMEARAFAAMMMYFAILSVIFYDIIVPRVKRVHKLFQPDIPAAKLATPSPSTSIPFRLPTSYFRL